MKSVFVAPFAVLHHFDTFSRILLVLVRTIIAALAFCACKSNSFTHYLHLTQSFLGPRPINMLKQYITRFSRKSILHLKKPGHPSETIVTHPLTKYNSLFLIFIVFFYKRVRI